MVVEPRLEGQKRCAANSNPSNLDAPQDTLTNSFTDSQPDAIADSQADALADPQADALADAQADTLADAQANSLTDACTEGQKESREQILQRSLRRTTESMQEEWKNGHRTRSLQVGQHQDHLLRP